MTPKNIFLTAILAGIAFSCTTEDLLVPDHKTKPDPIAGLPTTLSLQLSTASNIITKADTYDGDDGNTYAHATLAEQQVNNCVVAIFEMEGNDTDGYTPTTLKAFHTATPTSTSPAGFDDSVTGDPVDVVWEVTGIKTTTGRSHILVVANLPAVPLTDGSGNLFIGEGGYPQTIGTSTYAQFKEVATQVSNATFAADNLVKVGEKTVTLDESNNNITIPMIQLAARLDFAITIQLPVIEQPGTISFPASADTVLSLFNQDEVSKNKYTATAPFEVTHNDTIYTGFNCKDHLSGYYTFHNPYTNELDSVNLGGGNPKVIEIGVAGGGFKGLPIDSVFKTIRWDLQVEGASTFNVLTVSDVILDEFNSKQTPLSNIDITFDEDGVGVLKSTVYTYEKDNTTSPLSIQINCKLVQGTDIKRIRYYVRTHGLWIGTDGKPSGWGSGGEFVALVNEVLETGEASGSFEEEESTAFDLSLAAELPINGFAHGTLYDITTTITEDTSPAHFTTKSTGSNQKNYALLFKSISMPW